MRFWLLPVIFACAAIGGALASALGLPLAWMIGAMLVSTAFAMGGVRFHIDKVRSYGVVVLGLSLGQSFTPQVVSQILAFLPLILVCGFVTLLIGLPMMRFYTRGAGGDASTAFFCTVPGGVVLMAVQAHLARHSFLPNPWMIAPCVLAIVLQQLDLQPVLLPHWVIVVCQIILGVSLGSRMRPEFLRASGRLVVTSVGTSLGLTVILVGLALGIAQISPLDRAPLLFGMSPGGMPEMTVAAGSLGVSVPLVLSFHLTRILIANLLLEPIWHVFRRRVRL